MLPFAISDKLTEQFPLEYLEAVIEDVRGLTPKDKQDTVVIITPRGVVGIADYVATQGALVPVSHIYDAVSEDMKATIEKWLKSPRSTSSVPWLILLVRGSWFNNPKPDKPR